MRESNPKITLTQVHVDNNQALMALSFKMNEYLSQDYKPLRQESIKWVEKFTQWVNLQVTL